jgi:enoyl-CoA hydratase/carnithine racemase
VTAPRILRQDSAGLCTLTLNRPDKLNALDTRAFDELDGHLAELEARADEIGCVVIAAAGRAFCAGADLRAMGLRADGSPVDPAFKPGVIDRLAALPQPVIAAVHGACLTGGLELVLACDFIVADGSATFADTHGKWGLVSAWGMTQRLPRRIGIPAARRMMMTGQPVDAARAMAIGLVDELAPVGGLDAATRALAEALLASSWHTGRAIKRTLRETEGMSLEAALRHERATHPGPAPDHPDRLAARGAMPGA